MDKNKPMTIIRVAERGGDWPTKAMYGDWSAGWWLEDIGHGHIETHGPGRANTCEMRLGKTITEIEISGISADEVVEVIDVRRAR